MKAKQCTKCKKWKDESEFSRQRSRKDGLRCWCKECECEYIHAYYRRRSRKSVRENRRYEEYHWIVDGVKQKQCKKCKQWKPEDEFHKQKKSKDGLQFYCKECLNKANGRR